jgi:hypothetical protein
MMAEEVFVLVADTANGSIKPIGIDHDLALVDWVKRIFIHSSIRFVRQVSEIDLSLSSSQLNSRKIVLVSYEWLLNNFKLQNWLVFYGHLREFRKLNVPLWTFPVDPMDLDYAIKCSILAKLSNGIIVSASHTGSELMRFGMPCTLGPILWWLPKEIERVPCFNDVAVRDRIGNAVLAGSGGGIDRSIAMKALGKRLVELGFNVKFTVQDRSWSDYMKLVKGASIMSTSSWLQNEFRRKMWMHKDAYPKTILTGRIMEGFASGALVISNECEALKALGFRPGEHYLAFPDNYADFFDSLQIDLELGSTIARAGQIHLKQILETSADIPKLYENL